MFSSFPDGRRDTRLPASIVSGTFLRALTGSFPAAFVLLSSAHPVQALSAEPPSSPGTILVRFADAATKPTRALEDLGLASPERLFPEVTRKPARSAQGSSMSQWWLYRLSGELAPRQVADSLNTIPGVTAQPNYHYRFLGTPPDDPEWQAQWGSQRIRLDAVWQAVQADAVRNTVIGIVDSGVDYRHPDLAANVWYNVAEQNGLAGVDDDGNGYIDDTVGWDFTDSPDVPGIGDYLERDNDPMDEMGHGTQVAGVAAAVTNNGIGIAGTAPRARIMCLRAGAQTFSGSGFLEEDDIAAAIVYAVDNGADVINMSFGDVVSTPLLREVTAYANGAGVLLIAAAGNENTPTLLFPAGYDETIAVGATADTDTRASFSSYGENLDICAPGVGITTTNTGGVYRRNGGTSFASPFVAGAAAIVLSRMPHLTPTEMRSILRRGVVDLGPPGWDAETGYGRLDLPTLLDVASDPIASILTPERPTGVQNTCEWSAFLRGTPPSAWTLSYGIGAAPRGWTIGASGVLASPADTVRGVLSTAQLGDTVFCLRLSITDVLGRTSEDRTVVTVDRTAPVFRQQATVFPRWDGDTQRIFLKWTTDDVTLGTVRIWRGTSTAGAPILEFETASQETSHFEEIPVSVVGSGAFTAQVSARNEAGLAAESGFATGTAVSYSLPRSGYDSFSNSLLPNGVLMPMAADYNGNGVPEIVVKPLHRAAYDTVSFYEPTPSATFSLVAESPVAMRPSAVADIDGNGQMDLVGFDYANNAFRVRVSEIGQATPWWEEAGLVGPTVGDLTGDGHPEVIALVDADRALLKVFEGSAIRTLTPGAVLRSPIPGFDGRFGIWRTAGDFAGDQHTDIVTGTVGGSIVIFPGLGNGSFGDPVVLAGEGEATRVFGGIDLNGDGRHDFAVLRYFDTNRFETDAGLFRLEVYTGGATPSFMREFHDPRPDGNGFAVGQLGAQKVLAIAFPPRLYIVALDGSGVEGFVWFSDSGSPCQPVIADLDGAGGGELVFQGSDAMRVVRTQTVPRAPGSPQNLRVQVRDAQSVVVTWSIEPGLRYRVWTAPGDDLALAQLQNLQNPLPPLVLGGITPPGRAVAIAVQAVNPDIADSVGARSDWVTVLPHAGPSALQATRVAAGVVDATFDQPLHAQETTLRSFRLDIGTRRLTPSALIHDRSGLRVLLSFAASDIETSDSATLAYDLRDTSGAIGSGTIQITYPPLSIHPHLEYAVVTGSTSLRVAFNVPIQPATLVADSVRLLPAVAVAAIQPAEPGNRVFSMTLGAPLDRDSVYVLGINGVLTAANERFSTGGVLGGKAVGAAAPGISAVLQKSATEVWLVLSAPVDTARIGSADVRITPGVVVEDVSIGVSPVVLVVKVRSETPMGPWQTSYRVVAKVVLADRSTPTLEQTFVPLGETPATGRLREVTVLDATHLQLRFDLQIAATGQPAAPIRIEPGVHVLSYAVSDSSVYVTISDRTPVGSWGTTYYVRVDDLLGAQGEQLSELFAVRLSPPAGLDSMRVFPQPFRPAHGQPLMFGGLPTGTSLRLYALDGSLVREFAASETGGIAWDGRSGAGTPVASGIYLYVIDSSTGRKVGKIAVVR